MTREIFWLPLLIPTTSFLFLFLMKRQQRSLPPGPKKLPLIGNLHQLGGCLPHISLERLSNEYGPLMFLQLGSVPTLVISSADVARDIFKSHDNISFAPYGEYWREVRKIAILELLSSKRVQSFQAVRDEEVELMLQYIAQSSGPINLSRLTIGASRFESLMRETQAMLGSSSIADFFPWMEWVNKFNGRNTSLEKYFRELDNLLDDEIQEHHDLKRPKSEHEDLVDVLLRVQKDSSQVIALTNDHIKAVLNDIFFAGTDTSSAMLTWTMTELVRNSSAMKRAQNEVREIVKGKDKVDEEDLSKLMYLKLVLKEALRIHPPAPLLVPRVTTQDCSLIPFGVGRRGCPGVKLPAGMRSEDLDMEEAFGITMHKKTHLCLVATPASL
ncbi:hypothetical protein ACOSP7_025248 [Xanthoceras sorbifolium]